MTTLLHHVVHLGLLSTPSLSDILANRFQVALLDQHPLWDHSYLDTLPFWAFPEGFSIFADDQTVLNHNFVAHIDPSQPAPSRKDRQSNFILFDSQNQKLFCSSLVYYERVYVLSEDCTAVRVYVPRAVVMLSYQSVQEVMANVLQYLLTHLVQSKRDRQTESQVILDKQALEDIRDQVALMGMEQSPAEIEDIYTQRTGVSSLQVPVRSLHEALLSFLTSSPLLSDTLELKMPYIESTTCGSRKYHLGSDSLLSTGPRAGMKALLGSLQLEVISQVLLALLEERRVLLLARDPRVQCLLIETLLQLLRPLCLRTVYMPYLPVSMLASLKDQPSFLLGMHSKYYSYVKDTLDLSSVTLLHLDTQVYSNLPELPVSWQVDSKLRSQVSTVNDLSKVKKSLQEQFISQTTLALRKHFLSLMTASLGDYLPFFLFSQKYKTALHEARAQEIFDFEAYYESVSTQSHFLQSTRLGSHFLESTYQIIYHTEYLQVCAPPSEASLREFISVQQKRLSLDDLVCQAQKLGETSRLDLNLLLIKYLVGLGPTVPVLNALGANTLQRVIGPEYSKPSFYVANTQEDVQQWNRENTLLLPLRPEFFPASKETASRKSFQGLNQQINRREDLNELVSHTQVYPLEEENSINNIKTIQLANTRKPSQNHQIKSLHTRLVGAIADKQCKIDEIVPVAPVGVPKKSGIKTVARETEISQNNTTTVSRPIRCSTKGMFPQ